MPVARQRTRKAAGLEQLIGAAFEGTDFALVEQFRQRFGGRVAGLIQSGAELPQVRLQLDRHVFARKIPDDRAQLGLNREGHAVIDRPDVIGRVAQTVAGFAIGVVDQQIEQGDALELGGKTLVFFKGEVVFVGIAVDVELHHAHAVRPVAQNGGGHDEPIERLTDHKRGDFPLAQRAFGKIPQRTLALARFVNRRGLQVALRDADQESVVAAPRQQPLLFESRRS